MSQEKPERLVSASARPFPKLPQYTALFSLKFHFFCLCCFLVSALKSCRLPQRSCCTACWCNARRLASMHTPE